MFQSFTKHSSFSKIMQLILISQLAWLTPCYSGGRNVYPFYEETCCEEPPSSNKALPLLGIGAAGLVLGGIAGVIAGANSKSGHHSRGAKGPSGRSGSGVSLPLSNTGLDIIVGLVQNKGIELVIQPSLILPDNTVLNFPLYEVNNFPESIHVPGPLPVGVYNLVFTVTEITTSGSTNIEVLYAFDSDPSNIFINPITFLALSVGQEVSFSFLLFDPNATENRL